MSSSIFREAQRRINNPSIPDIKKQEENDPKPPSIFQKVQSRIPEREETEIETPEKQEPPKEESIWSQIKNFITSSEPNALEQGLERGLGIVGRGLSKAAGTPADIGLLANYLGQNILREDFPEIGNAPAPELLRNLSSEELSRKYDVATEGKYQPEGFLENLLQRGTEFGATGPFFGGKSALSGGALGRDLLAALGSTLAEEGGGGDISQMLGALGGGILPDVVSSLSPSSIRKGIAKGVGKLAGDNINPSVRKAVLEEGLKGAPPSIQSKSNVIKGTERAFTQNPFAGSKFETNLENVNKQVADNFINKVGKGIQDTYEESVRSGMNSKEFINNLYKKTEEYFGRAYEGIKQQAKDWSIFPEHYANTLSGLESSLKKTLAESPEKSSLLNDIASMRSRLYEDVGGQMVPRQVGLEELINTRTDLNSVYNRIKEFKGAQKFRKTFPKAINADLENLKQSHPDVYISLKKLDREYGSHRDAYNNKVIKAIRNEERPELVVGLIRQPSDLDKVEKILKSTNNGDRVLQGIKKAKLNQIFAEQFLDARNGVFDYKRYSSLLDMPQVDKWISKLATPSQIKSIRNLEKIADGFSEGAKYLTRHTESHAKELGGITQTAHLGAQLAKGDVKNFLLSGLGILGPQLMSSVYSDPEMIKIMLNTARAGKKHEAKSYLSGLKKIGKRLLQAAEVSPEEEESFKSRQRVQENTTSK